jgi:hypothetical protein
VGQQVVQNVGVQDELRGELFTELIAHLFDSFVGGSIPSSFK